jgi:hypothetical protein
MRTEEEATYDLNEQILELYDAGIPLDGIAAKVNAKVEYVVSVLNGVQLEAS